MSRPSSKPLKIVSLVLRAALFSAVLAVPVLAMPAFGSDSGSVIEAPTLKKKGAGFVILVSLQRR
ncbi:hypothetical protein ACSBOB_23500 [Mesorhizobium sp. ASY16-5R]|uniref:hypothetical protein n=1 Tax=Mesorhizobium sp. ASY16-5R TaxID=3445772 RepID=UPI003FA06664